MNKLIILLGWIFFLTSCNAQNQNNNQSESQDIDTTPPIYYGMPEVISVKDTSAGWHQKGQKILLTGTVFKSDGKTPASNILIYYYHTDTGGEYKHKEDVERSLPLNSMGLTHGYLRGWVKTDRNGKYSIYTIRPGTYPSRDEPAHVHVNIKEPNLDEHYYIDDFVFDDDRLLTTKRRKKLENRGGSGVIRFVQKDDLYIGERNIILGLNVPDYNNSENHNHLAGRSIGEDIISFTPYHAWGPDKGSKTCPICKYGWYHGILYFVGNNPNWSDIKAWLRYLETESEKREKHLKAYFIYGNEQSYNKELRERELEKIGEELKLEKVALTFVPSFNDEQSEIHLNKIDPNVQNTFLIYRRSNVIDKFVNLQPNQKNFELVSNRLDETINEYFDLPRPKKRIKKGMLVTMCMMFMPPIRSARHIHQPFLRNPPYGRLRRNGQAPALCAPMPCPAPHSLSPKGSKGSTPQNRASALIPKTAIFKNFFAFGETNFVKISALERRRCLTVGSNKKIENEILYDITISFYF